jgi:hypothetical protein
MINTNTNTTAFALSTFIKLFGSDGIQYIREEDAESAEALYTGSTLTDKKRVMGYGVPIDETFVDVFDTVEDASDRYDELRGGVTSGALVYEFGGIRERFEY